MSEYRLTPTARDSVDEIENYTTLRWGEEQAAAYVGELFAELGRIAERRVPWRPLSARFGFPGYCRHWRKHMIYWFAHEREVYFFTILHERMAQPGRARSAFKAAGTSSADLPFRQSD